MRLDAHRERERDESEEDECDRGERVTDGDGLGETGSPVDRQRHGHRGKWLLESPRAATGYRRPSPEKVPSRRFATTASSGSPAAD